MAEKVVGMTGKIVGMTNPPVGMTGKIVGMINPPVGMTGKIVGMINPPVGMTGKVVGMTNLPVGMTGKVVGVIAQVGEWLIQFGKDRSILRVALLSQFLGLGFSAGLFIFISHPDSLRYKNFTLHLNQEGVRKRIIYRTFLTNCQMLRPDPK